MLKDAKNYLKNIIGVQTSNSYLELPMLEAAELRRGSPVPLPYAGKDMPLLSFSFGDKTDEVICEEMLDLIDLILKYKTNFYLMPIAIYDTEFSGFRSVTKALDPSICSVVDFIVEMLKSEAVLSTRYQDDDCDDDGGNRVYFLQVIEKKSSDFRRDSVRKAITSSVIVDGEKKTKSIISLMSRDPQITGKIAYSQRPFESGLYKYQERSCVKAVDLWSLKKLGSSTSSISCSVLYRDVVVASFKDFLKEGQVNRVFWFDDDHEGDYSFIRFSLDGLSVEYGDICDANPKYLDAGYEDKPTDPFTDVKMLVWDIETYKSEDGSLIPFAIGVRWNGENNYKEITPTNALFYLTDYEGTIDEKVTKMFDQFTEFLLQDKFNGFKCYAHNFSGFDGPVSIGLFRNCKVKPLYSGNKLYQIKLSIKGIGVFLRDSCLLAPGSLKGLASSYGVSTQKGDFPHDFSSFDRLNYKGLSPCGLINDWDFKDELLKYLKADVDSLYEVLIIYRQTYSGLFGLDAFNSLTAPALAYKAFRKKYLKCDKIPLLRGNCEKNIRKSYRGGIAEVTKPEVENGNYYDINSLYPAAMKSRMPVGKPRYIIKPELSNFFGFLKAEIYSPPGQYLPFLPTVINERLVCPTGSWSGWYFSEELKYAASLGYKITPLSGYRFEEGVGVFDQYIDDIYEMKRVAIDAVQRYIAKLLLNSLYGKFGTKATTTSTDLFESNEFDNLLINHNVTSFMPLKEYSASSSKRFIAEYETLCDFDRCLDDGDYFRSVSKTDANMKRTSSSIGIASAITAYARVVAHKIKMISPMNLVYSDTDSFVLDVALPAALLNDKLGGLKLEYSAFDGLFPVEKCYILNLKDGSSVKKFKGLNQKDVLVEFYKKLRDGEPITVETERFSLVNKSKIKIKLCPIKIKPYNCDKRAKIYNSKGEWIDTKPLHVIDGIIETVGNDLVLYKKGLESNSCDKKSYKTKPPDGQKSTKRPDGETTRPP